MDYNQAILDSLPGKTLEKKYEALQKMLKKKDKVKMISFDESPIFNKMEFAITFKDWPKAKMKFYHESADSYSAQGNKYINWEKAIRNWASRDDAQKKYTWPKDAVQGNEQFNGLVL
jgi:hypothetical protein